MELDDLKARRDGEGCRDPEALDDRVERTIAQHARRVGSRGERTAVAATG